MTLKYSKPFPDWEIALGGPGIDIPAHVLAKKAGLTDTKAFIELLKGIPRGDSKAPKPANAQLGGPVADCGTPASTPRPCRPIRACTCPTARSSSRASARTSP